MLRAHLKPLELFLKSYRLYKGLITTVAVFIPLVPSFFLGYLDYGLPIAVGVFIVAPSDVPGSLRRKVFGILITLGLITGICLLMAIAKPYFLLFLMALALLSTCASLLSVYGLRGSMMAFSCMVSIVLSMVFDLKGYEILTHTGLITVGGFWYLLVSLFFYRLRTKKDVDQFLANTLKQTGHFLVLRGRLLAETDERDVLFKQSLSLQSQLNENHEMLRDLLLNTKRLTGRSHYDEKRLLIFTSLIDIYELTLANTWDYKKLDDVFKNHQKVLDPFKNANVVFGEHLMELSDTIIQKTKVGNKAPLLDALDGANNAIQEYIEAMGLPEAREGGLILKNLYDYLQQQLYRIRPIRRVIAKVKNASKISIKSQDADQFIPHQEYRFNIIKQHLSFQSPIFRHSIRLSTAIITGYLLGTLLEIKNTYWIILTLVVIMRPNYGLTKKRSFDRIKGTLLGAVSAFAIILLTDNTFILIGLGVFSMIMALAMLQQNYLMAATFVTTTIIFIFAIAGPNTIELIQYRIIDTAIGVVLALLANYLLWPNWEFMAIDRFILKGIQKNKDYLVATKRLYHSQTSTDVSYRIPRKEAFLAMSNLNAGFQRMSQDPKSKQKYLGEIYRIVTLNNTILEAIASLGSFIQNHRPTEGSEQFDAFIVNIRNNFVKTTAYFNEDEAINLKPHRNIEEAEKELKDSFKNLTEQRDAELEQGMEIKGEMLLKMQETHLLYNQLIWLKGLSLDLDNAVATYSASA